MLMRIKKEQYQYLQDFVVDLRNIFLSLHLYDIFLDLDLKHRLLSVGIGHSLREEPYSDYGLFMLRTSIKGFCEHTYLYRGLKMSYMVSLFICLSLSDNI